eukprot:TRINITY_DN13876_c0_g1_i3.p1 TRINITY_DN13876_c0_g1~~TRINITY_DN13876_c0_g1_i3.p1  ORF type:complete len:1078 (+),score=252.00 TRINITY_DN13876_c0_g1_i3:83-3235(+)
MGQGPSSGAAGAAAAGGTGSAHSASAPRRRRPARAQSIMTPSTTSAPASGIGRPQPSRASLPALSCSAECPAAEGGGVALASPAVPGARSSPGSGSIPSAVPWEPDEKRSDCAACKAPFSALRRRHHCRRCGRLVCADCSGSRAEAPGFESEQRVCSDCVSTQPDYFIHPFWCPPQQRVRVRAPVTTGTSLERLLTACRQLTEGFLEETKDEWHAPSAKALRAALAGLEIISPDGQALDTSLLPLADPPPPRQSPRQMGSSLRLPPPAASFSGSPAAGSPPGTATEQGSSALGCSPEWSDLGYRGPRVVPEVVAAGQWAWLRTPRLPPRTGSELSVSTSVTATCGGHTVDVDFMCFDSLLGFRVPHFPGKYPYLEVLARHSAAGPYTRLLHDAADSLAPPRRLRLRVARSGCDTVEAMAELSCAPALPYRLRFVHVRVRGAAVICCRVVSRADDRPAPDVTVCALELGNEPVSFVADSDEIRFEIPEHLSRADGPLPVVAYLSGHAAGISAEDPLFVGGEHSARSSRAGGSPGSGVAAARRPRGDSSGLVVVEPPAPVPEAWLVCPDTTTCFDVCHRDCLRFLSKLQGLRKLGMDEIQANRTPDQLRLDARDFRTLTMAQDLTEHYLWFCDQKGVKDTAPFFRNLAMALWSEAEAAGLLQLLRQGFEPGDVIFYDLEGRAQVRDVYLGDMLQQVFYHVQKRYDQHSHSGLFLLDGDGHPAIIHVIGQRVKQLRVASSWLYNMKREVDLAKVFLGWEDLTDEQRGAVTAQFRGGVQGWLREAPLVRNRTAEAMQMAAIIRRGAPEQVEAVPGVTSARALSTWRLTRADREALAAGPVTPAGPHVMCSGFTASVLLEVWLDVQSWAQATPEDAPGASALRALRVRPELQLNVLLFHPRNLHDWNVWKDKMERPPGVLLVACPAIQTSFEKLRERQFQCQRKGKHADQRSTYGTAYSDRADSLLSCDPPCSDVAAAAAGSRAGEADDSGQPSDVNGLSSVVASSPRSPQPGDSIVIVTTPQQERQQLLQHEEQHAGDPASPAPLYPPPDLVQL